MRKVTKLTEFVSKSNKGWGERDYLCIRKKTEAPNKPHPRTSLTPNPSPRGEGSRMKKEKGKSEK